MHRRKFFSYLLTVPAALVGITWLSKISNVNVPIAYSNYAHKFSPWASHQSEEFVKSLLENSVKAYNDKLEEKIFAPE